MDFSKTVDFAGKVIEKAETWSDVFAWIGVWFFLLAATIHPPHLLPVSRTPR
jgi:hypothetical protein